MSILKTLSYMLGNELDRTLLTLLDPNPDTFLDEKHYYKFVETLIGKNTKFTKADAVGGILKSTQKQNTWQGALRHLMVVHKLTHDLGEECFKWLNSEQMKHFLHFKTQETSLKLFIHKAMVAYYYKYLLKLSCNYEDLSICFHFDGKYADKLAENNISPLHSISKLQNTLRYLIQIFSLFEASLEQFTTCALVKQVAYFCFTDCYYYYTSINQFLSTLIKEFFTFPRQEAVLLYEIYSEHIIITRKLQSFFDLKDKIVEFNIKIPRFYKFDTEYNTKIELHNASLRSASKGISSKKMSFSQLPGESQALENLCDISTFSANISRAILDVITTNNINSSCYQQNLFEPPIIPNKKKNSVLNKLRAVHPIALGNNKTPATMPTHLGTRYGDFDKSIEVQHTRGSLPTNPRIDASGQFDRPLYDNEQSHNPLAQSTFPLNGNESYMNDDNNLGNISIVHAQHEH